MARYIAYTCAVGSGTKWPGEEVGTEAFKRCQTRVRTTACCKNGSQEHIARKVLIAQDSITESENVVLNMIFNFFGERTPLAIYLGIKQLQIN